MDENKQRFIFESFLHYEIFRKNSEERRNSKTNKEKYKKILLHGEYNKKESDEPEENINDLIKKIFSGSEKINDEDITFLMNYVEKTRKIKRPLLKY